MGVRKPAIDPGIGSHIGHKLINDRGNRGLSAKPFIQRLPCRHPLRSRAASQDHHDTKSCHPSPQHRLLRHMNPPSLANEPVAGVIVIALPQSPLRMQDLGGRPLILMPVEFCLRKMMEVEYAETQSEA